MSIQDKCILSGSDWLKLYPKGNYNKVIAGNNHGKTHFFHYLITLQRDQPVINFILSCKTVETLTQHDNKIYSLTPLALACMQGRTNVVNAILDKLTSWKKDSTILAAELNAYINASDVFGWTALHHATLTSEAISNRLQEMGADIHCKTNMDGTCADLRRLTTLGTNPSIMRAVKIEIDKDAYLAISEISKARLKELTGLEEYREEPYYPAAFLKKLWMADSSRHKYQAEINCKYRALIDSPPLLTIGKCAELQKIGIKHYELRAGEKIAKGRFIGQYGASFEKTCLPDVSTFAAVMTPGSYDPYEFNDMSALQFGNAIRFANNGFPNAYAEKIVVDGCARAVLIAMEDIEDKEDIVWEYGILNETGWLKQVPLRQHKMNAFFSQYEKFAKTLSQIMQRADSPLANYDDDRELTRANNLRYFPVVNPTTMLYLHFNHLFDIRMAKGLMVSERYLSYAARAWLNHAVANMVLKFETAIAVYPAEERALLKNQITAMVGNYNLAAIMKFMSLVESHCPRAVSASFINDLVLPLADYEAAKDEAFPLTVDFVTASTGELFQKLKEKYQLDDVGLLASLYMAKEESIREKSPPGQHDQVLNKLIAQLENLHPQSVAQAMKLAKE